MYDEGNIPGSPYSHERLIERLQFDLYVEKQRVAYLTKECHSLIEKYDTLLLAVVTAVVK